MILFDFDLDPIRSGRWHFIPGEYFPNSLVEQRGRQRECNDKYSRGMKGQRAANIIINQRDCDVNVKLPEPIWSCITRGGLGGIELANCKNDGRQGRGWPDRPLWELFVMVTTDPYGIGREKERERREWKRIDDTQGVVVPIGRLSMVIACTKRHM